MFLQFSKLNIKFTISKLRHNVSETILWISDFLETGGVEAPARDRTWTVMLAYQRRTLSQCREQYSSYIVMIKKIYFMCFIIFKMRKTIYLLDILLWSTIL